MKLIHLFFFSIILFVNHVVIAEAKVMKLDNPSIKVQLPKGAFWIKNHWQCGDDGLSEIEPHHWRSTTNAGKILSTLPIKLNQYGVDQLFISGSAAPSLGNILWLKKILNRKHPIYLIDLRQETHLYLNKLPISLFYKRDEINWGKSSKVIHESEQAWVQHFTHSGLIQINKLGKPHAGIKVPTEPEMMPVKEITIEEKIALEAKVAYFRIEVPDYHPPTPAQVDKFLEIIKNLPANAWLHFHCAAGNGRTTTFMIMRDILANSEHVSLEDIISRQAALGGVNLFGASSSLVSQPWKEEYHRGRVSFIRLFYTYTHTRAHLNQNFSSWITKQPNNPYKQLLTTSAY